MIRFPDMRLCSLNTKNGRVTCWTCVIIHVSITCAVIKNRLRDSRHMFTPTATTILSGAAASQIYSLDVEAFDSPCVLHQ